MALKGAELLIYPTAIGLGKHRYPRRKDAPAGGMGNRTARSRRSQRSACHCRNRVGLEPDPSGQTNGIQFWGNSFVAGPQGEIIAQTSNLKEENMVVEIDMNRSENVRRWWPFLRDRRIDEFEQLTRRFID